MPCMCMPTMQKTNATNASRGQSSCQYVLITAARDERAHISATLGAVARQTVLPLRWVIFVNDSTDGTLELVRAQAGSTPYIVALDGSFGGARSFGNKSRAVANAFAQVAHLQFSFVGILDADLSFGPCYYETLIKKFLECPRLGIATGTHVESFSGGTSRVLRQPADIAVGGMQFFRRACFAEIGGFRSLRWGGVDTLAGVMARERGWLTRTFADIQYQHLREMGTEGVSTILETRFKNGRRDQKLGMHPIYGALKFLKRFSEKPYFLGSLAWLAGYVFAAFLPTDPEIPFSCRMSLRREQAGRLRSAFSIHPQFKDGLCES